MGNLDADPKQFQGWFNAADTDGDGRVNGNEAVVFFGRSGLSKQQLAKVWVLADQKRQGSLNLKNFAVALWLIGNAQQGLEVSVDAVMDGEKITPTMRGINEGDVDEDLARRIKGAKLTPEPSDENYNVSVKKTSFFSSKKECKEYGECTLFISFVGSLLLLKW